MGKYNSIISREIPKCEFQRLYGLARIHNKMADSNMLGQSRRLLGDDYVNVAEIRYACFAHNHCFSVQALKVRLTIYKVRNKQSFCKDAPF